MKYYVLKYKYLHTTSEKGNLGDNIQSIAAINMLNKLDIKNIEIDYLNRDDLAIEKHNQQEGIFIAQGWFGCMPGQKSLPINDRNIHPLYFGFHINEGSWHLLRKNLEFINSMKKNEPIGCRDLGTRDFLRSLQIKAYFSKCLTMTLDKRRNSTGKGKVFLIDNYEEIEKYIPLVLQKKIVKLSQEDYSTAGFSPSGEWPMNDDDVKKVDKAAYERLELIKNEAALVVTKRIHIAMPCAAMGIPVIFCYHNKFDVRASVVKEILPVYERKDFKDIDWNVQAPNIEEVKSEMQLIFAYRLQVEENKLGRNTKRLSDSDYFKAERLVEHACTAYNIDVPYKKNSFEKEDVLNVAFGKHIPIVLFGAGSAGSHLCSILQYYGINPACFCDNKVNNDSEIFCNNLPVITFKTLKEKHRNAIIMITTKIYLEPIKNQLKENDFSDNQIIEGIPFIDNYIDFAVPQD